MQAIGIFNREREHMNTTHEEKLKKALEYLGKKHCLSKDSTLRYKRGPSVLNNTK
jgi:hypothetical protein